MLAMRNLISVSRVEAIQGSIEGQRDGRELTTNDRRLTTTDGSIKRRQLYQIVLRNRLDRLAGLAPGSQSADNHERVESFFPQQVRHPGAGRFARSSTVKINVLVLGKVLDLFLKIVGLDADRSLDPGSPRVIVAVAADVDDQHAPGISRSQTRGQFLHLNPRHHSIL